VTSIGDYAFYGCSGLTSVAINCPTVGSWFSGLTSIQNITLGDYVTSIGNQVFSGCSGLISIVVNSNNSKYDSRNNCNAIIETETNTLVQGCNNSTIPESVTSIGNGAFHGCWRLTSITIPEGVTSIGDSIFYGCI